MWAVISTVSFNRKDCHYDTEHNLLSCGHKYDTTTTLRFRYDFATSVARVCAINGSEY